MSIATLNLNFAAGPYHLVGFMGNDEGWPDITVTLPTGDPLASIFSENCRSNEEAIATGHILAASAELYDVVVQVAEFLAKAPQSPPGATGHEEEKAFRAKVAAALRNAHGEDDRVIGWDRATA